ncbi:MAG TPA: lamin tail domain-containing protein, partial [Verrucomicrobiae bacterium]
MITDLSLFNTQGPALRAKYDLPGWFFPWRFFFLLAMVLVSGAPAWGANVLISEFMAINNTTLKDEDGSYSDWIELYNSSTDTVNLGGWYLANSVSNLTKWQFPATNLGPNRFLVVFASNKDRRVPGAPLHTNFKLSGSGEYLALVLPDGLTRASEFAPAFPQQYADISYGYVMTGAVSTLVAPTASARTLVPSAAISATWQLAGFNDSGWTSGTLGAGYDTSGNYAPAIGLDLRAAMLNVNASAYVRVPFTVADPALYNSLSLSLRYDDGFVAWLNGTNVLSRNAPAIPAWNSAATAAHGTPPPGSLFENFEGTATNYTLSQFGAAPAPAVQAADSDSTGKFLRLLYDGVNSSANSISFRQTASGLFQTIIADFDFRVAGASGSPADGFSFLLIPT